MALRIGAARSSAQSAITAAAIKPASNPARAGGDRRRGGRAGEPGDHCAHDDKAPRHRFPPAMRSCRPKLSFAVRKGERKRAEARLETFVRPARKHPET